MNTFRENVISWSRTVPVFFRICPITKFKIHRDAENLLKLNIFSSIIVFSIGAISAILLALTRWNAVQLLTAEWYYRILTSHGINMLIFFILFFEMALFYHSGPIVLNCRLPVPIFGWAAFFLKLCGVFLVEYTIFSGHADVLFTSYVPLKAHLLYYAGIALFAVGALLVTMLFFITLIVAKKERTYEGSVPLYTFGATAAAVISVITILHGAAIYLPTLFWAAGHFELDSEIYRIVFWALGHSSQQINVCFMVSIWYCLGAFTCGSLVLNEKISRVAFFLYILFISMASAHHLLVDPGVGPAWKIWNTSYAMYLAVLASLLHGFTVPGGIEMALRIKGFNNGKFEWLIKAPWSDPGFSGLFLSLIIFGFIGGVTGVTLGAEQINIIAHNTLRITGHFHGTVVGGTTLCFMAFTYYLLPLYFNKKISFWNLAKIQPYVFAFGIVLMALSMISLGIFGVPRRHWDMLFTGSFFNVDFPPIINFISVFLGLGGIIAFVGALFYIIIVIHTILFGEEIKYEQSGKISNYSENIPQGLYNFTKQEHDDSEAEKIYISGGVQGTVFLVMTLFICFVLYYFANWQLLSSTWKIG